MNSCGDLIQLGQHEGHNLLIQYDNSIPESVQEEVVCHELVHALIQNSGLDQVLENEEQVASILENILWQFLINNTEVFNEG